jgi:hypothetical protein
MPEASPKAKESGLSLKAKSLNFLNCVTTVGPHEKEFLTPSGNFFEICLIASNLKPRTPISYQKFIISAIASIVSGCSQFKSTCSLENK